MVEWQKDLYLDGITKHMVDKIKDRAERERVQYPFFVVSLASNEDNLLDIMHINELLFPYYRKRTTKVLGVAGSRQQAKIMAAAIISKVYQDTGTCDVRKFFQSCFE